MFDILICLFIRSYHSIERRKNQLSINKRIVILWIHSCFGTSNKWKIDESKKKKKKKKEPQNRS